MRTLIVHNPRSGFGSDAIYEFERALVREGDECVLRLLTSDRKADAAALADAESFDLVVVSGGDGTVSHALYELRKRNVTTCVFPSGTANLLAANIGNASEPAALAAACRARKAFSADLGEMSWTDTDGASHVSGFALMAGAGFDAQLMHDAIPGKALLGEAAYFAAALVNPKPDVYQLVVEVDGERHEHEGIGVLVANNATMQGDIEIVPDCSMDDGLLDVIVLETTDAAQLLRPLMAGLVDPTGKGVGRPRIASYQGRHVRVSSNLPMKLELDGDVAPGEVMGWEAQVIPACCRLVCDRMSRYAHQG